MGHYHPHGDSSIYEAMVRLAQDFNERYMLVDGHGNFGNIEGDGAAAYRYTEARLSKISLELLRDINKDTVDMDSNFDETCKEPSVLPSRFPNILVNGTMGIAVGMATNIPPHNLGEVIDGCVAFIDNPDITTLELMNYIKGPDFPTGGIILGNSGIKKAYETGRGTITIRSRAEIEEHGNHSSIVFTEVPYGVNTLELKNKVAELVHNKIIDGIADYHTDLKDGVKITITLKKDANPNVVLNNLYKHTNFQISYGIIFLMLDGLTPKTLGLKDIISKYIDHQKIVIIRRTKFDLAKAEKRVHILEGYKIALDHIDEVIRIIRNAESDIEAKEKLISCFGLSDIQADAILELKLRRLTALERDKIEEELKVLSELMEYLTGILEDENKLLEVIKEELLEIKEKYADVRRTRIEKQENEIDIEDLIQEEDVVITLSHAGYIKRISADVYSAQKRGGKGIQAMTTKEDDFVENIFITSTHANLLFFTNKGKAYKLKAYEIPDAGRTAKGMNLINLLPLETDEVIQAVLALKELEQDGYLFMCTKQGIVKKTCLSEFKNLRRKGLIALSLKDGDELLKVKVTYGDADIMIVTEKGYSIRFNEKDVRAMGRNAAGVKAITLRENDIAVCMDIVVKGEKVLVISENAYGKRTNIEEYKLQNRGGMGLITYKLTEKTGKVVGATICKDDDEIMLINSNGVAIRVNVADISITSRATMGVKVM